jgi:hypothetical protein
LDCTRDVDSGVYNLQIYEKENSTQPIYKTVYKHKGIRLKEAIPGNTKTYFYVENCMGE